MTGPRQRLDELDAAAARLVGRTEGGEVIPAYAFLNADAQDAQRLALALPALTSALRAVADLADGYDGAATDPGLSRQGQRLAAQTASRIRAALAPLAAPDTGDETT